MNPTFRALIVAVCVGGTIFALVMWHGAWSTLQEHLAVGDFCLDLAALEDIASTSEVTALGCAGLTFAVLPVVVFSKSSADLFSLLFVIASTYFAFAPASLTLGLEGAHRVATVVTLGVVSVLVFVIANAFRKARAADAATNPPPPRDRGYEERFWQTWPLTVLAAMVIVAITATAPLLRPYSSSDGVALDTVSTHLDQLRSDDDLTKCGGGRTEPERGPTSG